MPRNSVARRSESSATGTSFSVRIQPYALGGRPRPRSRFKSDEEFHQYNRNRATYLQAAGTAEWRYPRPVDRWSAADIDAVILRVLTVMANLPVVADDDWRYRARQAGELQAGAVSFEYATGRRRGPYTRLFVTSLRTPYRAYIQIDGTVPARALTMLLEQHGQCDGQFAMRMDGFSGYAPSFHLADSITIREGAQ